MFRFRGFKASLNLGTGKSHGIEHYDKSPGVSLIGAYRTNKDEQFGFIRTTDSTMKATSSTVRPPTKNTGSISNHSKSTSNLTKPTGEKNFRKSSPNLTQTSSQTPKIDTKKQKELEKKLIAEQVKQEKLAAKERLREEKMQKEGEKNQRTKVTEDRSTQKKSKKRIAPQPQQQKIAQENIITSSSQPKLPQHSTNTLERSISKSSGPPPYTSLNEIIPNQNDNTGNISFVKPADDTSSWDIISQHREQMSRQPGVSKNIPKQTHLDLNYNVGTSRSNGNINSNA